MSSEINEDIRIVSLTYVGHVLSIIYFLINVYPAPALTVFLLVFERTYELITCVHMAISVKLHLPLKYRVR